MHHHLNVKLLGTLQLIDNDEPFSQLKKSKRTQLLLAYLILNRNRPCMRDEIAFLFWPDTTDKQARTNLGKLIYDARKWLPNRDELIQIDEESIQWQPTIPYSLDIQEFEQALTAATAQRDDVAAYKAALEAAVDLYSADLLKRHYEDWILAERDRLHQLHISALEELMQVAEQQRDFRGAIRYGYRLLRHERLHEATYCALIRLYRCCGERGLAIRMYKRCEQVLKEMLDVLPSIETQAEFALVV